jgi:preprotein translocase subunit SecE
MAIEAKAKVPAARPAVKAAPAAPAKPRVSPSEFVRQVRAETAKVAWPTLPETMRMTVMVLIMTTILSVFFLGVDQVLGRLVKFLLSLAA